ncbi:MAG: hypothetical protein BroJett018_47820 [Chloroflexota bacterium]|nr:hypothetical protein [Chloroflexota bacterium]NOG65824.1 hypothetical protein [Chloroflexota bacterium]GIK66988.1 MAG: hypothetical protein BroJett018_47820 [Chloroflexota bacterium]
MNEEQFEEAIYESLDVDLICTTFRPTFGQLFQMLRGFDHPYHPVEMEVQDLSELGFDQVDDYWGLRSDDPDVGDDVLVWLFPLVDGIDVYHHHGPFDGFRLSYCVLRNSPDHLTIYLTMITRLAEAFSATAYYQTGEMDLGSPPNLAPVETDAWKIIEYWRNQGIEPGSHEALRLDF